MCQYINQIRHLSNIHFHGGINFNNICLFYKTFGMLILFFRGEGYVNFRILKSNYNFYFPLLIKKERSEVFIAMTIDFPSPLLILILSIFEF